MNNFFNLQSCSVKRTLQMLVAVSIAIVIYKSLSLAYGYWIALSAIITIQATTGASIKRARERLFGTVMGVLAGVALVNLLPPNHLLLLLIVPVLIFLAVYLFSNTYSYSIFFASILLVLLMANSNVSPWQFAFARIQDTAIGLAIGLAASYLLWPNASQDELQESLREAMCACMNYFNAIIQHYLHAQPVDMESNNAALESALLTSINSFKMFSYEPGIMKVTAEAVYAFIVSINTIASILSALNLAAQAQNQQHLSTDEKALIQQFIEQINLGFKQIAVNFEPENKALIFDFNTFSTDYSLLDEQKVKQMLIERQPDKLGLILLVYQLKKLAFELKYMNQTVRQLTNPSA